MIQFLGKWIDPKHIIAIGKPYVNQCSIAINIDVMFRNNPIVFYKPLISRVVNPSFDGFDNDLIDEDEDMQIRYKKMMDNWRFEVDEDHRRQASEFERSPEYVGLINQV